MKQIISIIFAIACGNFIFAQQNCKFQISGIILSAGELSTIAGVEIFIEKGHYKTVSDDNGSFLISNICDGIQLLELDAPGFEHLHIILHLSRDTQIILQMTRRYGLLDSVHIEISKRKNRALENADFIRSLGMDLAHILQGIPGMAVLQTGNNIAKPVFQGFTGLRLPIYINGIRQEGQQWGNEHGPEISATGYEVISILRGAKTLEKTHDALAGLIFIENNSYLHPGQLDLESGLGFNSNGRQISAFSKIFVKPFVKKYSWFGSASIRKGGNYMAPEYTLANTGLFEFSANAGLVWDPSERWWKRTLLVSYFSNNSGIFSGSRIGNVADLDAAIHRTEPLVDSDFKYRISSPLQTVRHSALSGLFESAKKHRQKFSFGLQYDNRREYDLHRNSKTRFPQLDLYLMTVYGEYSRILHGPRLCEGMRFGSNVQVYNSQYGGYFFIPNYRAITQGIFLTQHLNGGYFNYDMALRLDGKYLNSDWSSKGISHSETRSFFNYSAAFTANRRAFSIHLMRMWRAPWVNELYSYGVHHGSAAFERGDPKLKMETDYKVEIVYDKNTRKKGFYLSVFSNYMPSFINLSPDTQAVLTVRGAFPSYTYKQFLAWYSGGDAKLELRFNNILSTMSQVSFIYARDLSHNTFPAYIPPLTLSQGLIWSRKKITLNLTYSYCFKQFLYTSGSDYLPPPPAYSLWNFSMEIKKLFKKQNYQLFFNVDNIFNISYRNYLDRFRYYTDMPGRNISIKLIQNLHHHHEK